MTHFSTRVLMLAAVLAAVPATAPAQQDPMDPHWRGYRDVHHRNQCRLANQVLTRGEPANQRDWALRIITTCGPLGGVTIGQLLRDHRHEADWAEGLEEVVRLTADLVDRSIYSAAVEVAADPAAGTAARVQALRALYYQITPGARDPYESFLPGTRRYYVLRLHGPAIGEPLPPDALHELFVLASGIAADPATNDTVRSAATKLQVAAEVEMQCADTVTLGECGDRILKPDGSPWSSPPGTHHAPSAQQRGRQSRKASLSTSWRSSGPPRPVLPRRFERRGARRDPAGVVTLPEAARP